MTVNTDKNRDSGGIKAFKEALKTTAYLLKITMLVLILAFLFSNVRYLEQFEKAVVLRFGAIEGAVRQEAGMHFALPYPVDQVVVVNAGRTQTVSSDTFMYQKSRTNEVSPFLKPGVDGYLLTADGNVMHCYSTLTYSVRDVNDYIFSVRKGSMESHLKMLMDNSLLKAASQLAMEQILDKKELDAASTLYLQRQIDDLGLGVQVEILALKLIVPRQVEANRQEVTKAKQDKARLASAAALYERQNLDLAESEASKIKSAAAVWKTKMMARAKADLQTLNDLAASYRQDPRRVKEMLLRDAMVELTPSLEEVFVFNSKKNREIRIVMPRQSSDNKAKADDSEK